MIEFVASSFFAVRGTHVGVSSWVFNCQVSKIRQGFFAISASFSIIQLLEVSIKSGEAYVEMFSQKIFLLCALCECGGLCNYQVVALKYLETYLNRILQISSPISWANITVFSLSI